ncbi:hypothetical protein OAG71_03330 [bacterium]|nr:hypothetical protein [bacterium]
MVCQLISLEGYSQLTDSIYGEASLTEKMQIVFSGICCVLFLMTARLSQQLRPVAIMLAALTGMMLIRESDAFLDKNVFDGAWQTLVVVVLFATAIYLKKQPNPIKPSLEAFSRLPSAGMLVSGFLVTFVISRLFGRRSFWEAVMGEGYVRVVKNIVEEGTELVGYSLILIAAVDLVWYSKSQSRELAAIDETQESPAQPDVNTKLKLILGFEENGLQEKASIKLYDPSQAENELLELVQQHGLSEEEAVDLVDSWRHKIFQHPSKRAA